MNTKLVSELKDIGLHASPGPKKSVIHGRLGGVRKFTQAMVLPRACGGFKHFKHTLNTDQMREYCTNESFAGGSFESHLSNLDGNTDMRPFLEAKEILAQSDVSKRVSHRFAQGKPRRARTRSEHDGDWNYSNRWDIRPYDSAVRVAPPIKVLNLIADFSISARTEASSINRFGALVWALSDLIEQSGINTRVVFRNCAKGTGRGDLDTEVRVTLKEPGEYLNPKNLAAALTSMFYRYSVFGLMTAACDAAGREVEYGLGRPERCESVEFKDGELIVASSTTGLTPEAEKALYQALNIKSV